MKKKIPLLISALLMLTFAISGCENIVLVPGRSSGAITESSEASEPLSAYPVTLNDTEILKAPEKIVSLTPAYTEILFEMGYGDRIVAVSDYCDYPESVKECESRYCGDKKALTRPCNNRYAYRHKGQNLTGGARHKSSDNCVPENH